MRDSDVQREIDRMTNNRTMVSFPADSKPDIQWDHIDGPLLHCTDGTIHWLTLLERLYMKIGILSLEQLDHKYRQDMPQKG